MKLKRILSDMDEEKIILNCIVLALLALFPFMLGAGIRIKFSETIGASIMYTAAGVMLTSMGVCTLLFGISAVEDVLESIKRRRKIKLEIRQWLETPNGKPK